uniref:Putative GATA transcription factor 2-like n=1 Tax=Davidia involucrata TaxID=16924 RepID=A0A5B6YVE9_DAVIN
MDFCRNVSVSGGLPSEYPPEQVLSPRCSKLGSLDDLFSCHNTEGDVSLEWLSIFVEDCLSSTGNCLPPAPSTITNHEEITTTTTAPEVPSKALQLKKPQTNTCSGLQKFVIPGKARSKRKRGSTAKTKTPLTSWSHHLNPQDQILQMTSSDPPLLQQAYWLADSELIIFPKKEDDSISSRERDRDRDRDGEQEGTKEEEAVVADEEEEEEEEGMGVAVVGKDSTGSLEAGSNGQQQPRRCTHCLAQRTPQWRAGPLGPKTLCNACGVRYKSGRLLPEYRPAKSPTFVSYKHSNSHKKVMEMRMALPSSIPTQQH